MRRRPLTISALVLCLAGAATACSGVEPTVAVSGEPRATESAANIASVLAEDSTGRFTTLLACVEAAGVASVVTGTGPVTLFAPTNDAFRKAGVSCDPEKPLSDRQKETLVRTLAQHVVNSDVRFSAPEGYDAATPPRGLVLVTSSRSVPSILADAAGTALNVGTDKMVKVGSGTTASSAKVVEADLQAPNGLIQVIDSVLVPPAKAAVPPTTAAPKPFE